MDRTNPWMLGAALALCAGVALGHDDTTLATMKAPNGGQMKAAGPLHLELVVARDGDPSKERPLVLYVTDHAGKKVDTQGASGTATLLSGNTRASVQFNF